MDDKARIDQQHSQLCSWLCDAAYPLWSTAGVDPAGGFHERLAQNGKPLVEPRRSRVNPRQAYCFAMAPSLGWRGDAAGLIRHALDYFVARYQRPDGLFRTLIAADGSPLDDRALLYDQAFALLAFNVAAAGGESRAVRERQSFELHALVMKHMKRAGQGFQSGVPASLPLQSNPHMHLFEAALAGCEVCSDSSVWKPLSDEIAELALNKFVDAETGALREFFDEQWNPAARHPRPHRGTRASVRMGLAAAAVGRNEKRARARGRAAAHRNRRDAWCAPWARHQQSARRLLGS